MAIRLFEVTSEGIFPSEHCLTNIYYKGIIDEYGANAGKVFAFLHYMCSLNPHENPYFNIPEAEKKEVIHRSVCPELDLDSDLIDYCLDITRQLYETPIARGYYAQKSMLDKLATAMRYASVVLDADGGNAGELVKGQKLYQELKQGYKEAYSDLLAEMGVDKNFGGIEQNKYSEGADELE